MISPALALVGFVAPWMAWGAAVAVGLPILAHLLSRTRYKEVAFPAARLVKQAVAATSRIETPRHRLLMLLRWLVLLVLVLAFMRPQWTPKALAGEKEQGIALVLLVDASASMQRAAGGATLYDRALREAQRLIDQLDPSRDVAAVVRVDHAPASLLPETTAQISLLSDRLIGTKPGYTHANWAGALATAQRLVVGEPRTVRLITISDQQGEQPGTSAALAEQHSTPVDHVRIEGPTDNTSVRIVDVRPYPAIAGQPVTATAEAQHYGESTVSLRLACRFGLSQINREITLEPRTSQRVDFTLPAAAGGRELIQIRLDQADEMPSDNLTGRALSVQERTAALVIHDPSAASEAIAPRLATLLNPGRIEGVTLPSVETMPIAEAERAIQSADPTLLRTVVLVNVSALPDVLSQSLEAYARAGGGVVQFVIDDDATGQTTTAAGVNFDLGPLRIFEGPARAGLAALRWQGVGNAPIDQRATPILMDEQERVIVAEMQRGRGRLIAINATLTPEPGGLLAEPSFVVLFNELCRYASPGPALPEPARPGDAIPARLLNADRFVVAKNADPDATVFTAPGRYAGMDGSGFVQELVFVELDPSESDTSTPPVWSAAHQSDANNTAPSDWPAGSKAAPLRDNPIELWPYLVLGVLGLAACESLLLWRFAGTARSAMQGGAA
ncbi:MAG: BatA domain-containing protein [Phycisphaeraceae bacterium]|nr:BatA domain-containing protein [Phycisphaeraceae bacterium]